MNSELISRLAMINTRPIDTLGKTHFSFHADEVNK
jgi:hypothetical protein